MPDIEHQTHNGQTILLIDDDIGIQMIITMILEDAGYTVVTAGDGSSGLAMLEHTIPDLILLDSFLPVMSAEEFLRALQDTDQLRHLKVILLTADNQVIDRHQIMSASQCISKPFDVDYLLNVIAQELAAN